jgi:hypothetical protein
MDGKAYSLRQRGRQWIVCVDGVETLMLGSKRRAARVVQAAVDPPPPRLVLRLAESADGCADGSSEGSSEGS